jgi:glycosyltransferase involved in cell wall biosynthesis
MTTLFNNNERKAISCDVMLLLEWTFPFVGGGVSNWVNQLILGFPDMTFGICFLGSQQTDYGPPKYVLPKNVVHMEQHFIMDRVEQHKIRPQRGNKCAFASMRSMHETMRARSGQEAQINLMEVAEKILPMLRDGKFLDEAAFLYSEESWHYIEEQYHAFCTDPSFVDYFWTVRLMHAPIWTLSRIADALIPARCYHTISTGYAGFLGALLKQRNSRPLILSEHGIYTKERKIDLFQSTWIRDNRGVFEKDASQIAYLRDAWIRFFETLGRMCYEAADAIVALYETNRLRQIHDGAPEMRTQNIANGIDLSKLAVLRFQRQPTIPPVLCLIGRIVPIKDIKTFIRAMRTVINLRPDAEGWIAGLEDEDPAYATECRSVVKSLGMQDKIKFLGYQRIDELMPHIGLIILSSISEALPLVLLEGFAAGVPAVTTDVGACRQLIYGLDAEDRALGAAGDVVGIAEPEDLARSAVSLLNNSERWHSAQAAGIARVERYYSDKIMLEKYKTLYQQAFSLSLMT